MKSSPELEQRHAALRAEARRGAETATFRAYEQLWRDARAAGDERIAREVLRDLARLTAAIDPEVGRALARASGPAPARPAVPELSVVVLGVPGATAASPALRSLEAQTLAPSRFETLVAAGSGAADCDAALRAAGGRVVLFVDHDVELRADALERHLAAHAQGAPPCALAGALEWRGLELRPLAWALAGLGLLGAQDGIDAAGELPAECLDLAFASFPRVALLQAGGIHPALGALAGAELGVRLAAAGWRIAIDPALAGTRAPRIDLAAWLARCRAMGADWRELRRLHGGAARPAWLGEIGLEETALEPLFARLLASADRHHRCVAALRDSLDEVEQLVARRPQHAAATLERVADDLNATLLDVSRHELARGFVHAAQGGARERLETAARTERGAAVVVLSSDASGKAVELALGELPPWGELVVGVLEGAPPRALPADRRIRTILLAKGAGAPALKQRLLEATGADFFVLLDGSCVPTAREWEALRLTLATLPAVGACNVEGEAGALATAAPCAQLSSALVAVRRDVIESDGEEAGPLLERLVRRGYRLATCTAAREPAACAS